ncbi:hypothetical protein B8V81_4425 [Paenibacillus pasadenensis]|uniref:Uncharacterized protein n=1 Tax=Paenibacillus pasadenensis TaxID=217090 RepID=A0A2N5N6L7_9BACL|nr:hypothetical protein B8V81_4425 [Paenibacillus pasadenensis]
MCCRRAADRRRVEASPFTQTTRRIMMKVRHGQRSAARQGNRNRPQPSALLIFNLQGEAMPA